MNLLGPSDGSRDARQDRTVRVCQRPRQIQPLCGQRASVETVSLGTHGSCCCDADQARIELRRTADAEELQRPSIVEIEDLQ